MRVLHKELTYEFATIEELEAEILKEEIEGWDVERRGHVQEFAITDKLYCSVKYRLRD